MTSQMYRYHNDEEYREEYKKKVRNRHQKRLETDEEYRAKHRAKIALLKEKPRNIKTARAAKRRYSAKLKAEVFLRYGNRCVCCGETELAFLTIDHINRDGAAHRKSLSSSGGTDIYADLKRRGFPADAYRLLCMNCNWATRHGSECPHEIVVKNLLRASA